MTECVFGARSGASVVFLGIGKLVIGLIFGNFFVRILNQFPIGILRVLLLFAGIELAMASKDMNTKEQSFVMLVCAAMSLTGPVLHWELGCEILLHLLLKLRTMECSYFEISRYNSKASTFDVESTPLDELEKQWKLESEPIWQLI